MPIGIFVNDIHRKILPNLGGPRMLLEYLNRSNVHCPHIALKTLMLSSTNVPAKNLFCLSDARPVIIRLTCNADIALRSVKGRKLKLKDNRIKFTPNHLHRPNRTV